ncbi:hypothetical protein [Nocardioides stalactiti]|uniref:hypothetical protein n=1 Tax=Nocardioides stalactiti TaxID=2755356 RepID=UPI0016027098|nr:hypothetical protein [Nocardioides stalactiti]
MRKQIIGATAAILSAGALSIGLPAAPTHGIAWKTQNTLPFPAGAASNVEIAATGDGDAVAAAIIDGAVYATTATDGVWNGYAQVRGDVDATGLKLAAGPGGKVALGWVEDLAGDLRYRVARQTGPSSWSTAQFLTPGNGADVTDAELGIAGNGRIVVAATIDDVNDDINDQLIVTEWPEAGAPGTAKVISTDHAWGPSLDVNTKGEALLAWTYNGLNTDVVNVARRAAGGTWNLGNSTQNSGDVAAAPDVALSDNGQGQVIFAVVKNGFYVAETSRILPNGTVEHADTASPLDEYVYDVSVDINDSGSALFTWIAKKDQLAKVRYSTAANQADPGTAQALPGSSLDVVNPVAKIADDGLKVIQYASAGYVTTQYRTGAGAQQFVPFTTTNGHAIDQSVDVDPEGNAVSVVYKPGGSVFARFLDASGPTVELETLPANMLVNPPLPMTIFPISWTMDDSLSAIPNSDVYATTAAWNEAGHSDPYVIVDNVSGTEAEVPWILGTTYCIQVRPTDTAGNSTTTEKQCTTVPLDDRALVGEGWNKTVQTGNFRNTLLTTNQQGRVLTRNAVKAKRLALVVRKVANGGTVKVTFDGDVLGTYSLDGTGKKKVIPMATFGTVKSGQLKIQVTSADGKLVSIDGVVIAK